MSLKLLNLVIIYLLCNQRIIRIRLIFNPTPDLMEYMRELIKNIYVNRRMAMAMAFQEMRRRYAGTTGRFV